MQNENFDNSSASKNHISQSSKAKTNSSFNMPNLEQEWIDCMNELNGDEEGKKTCWDYMLSSTAIYKGEIIRIGYVPKLVDAQMMKHIDQIQQTTYKILQKVIAQYMDNPSYRALFKFDEQLEKLIMTPTGYSCDIPIGRFDIFLNEQNGDFYFCEFNTDGSSAMNEDRESANSLCLTQTFKSMNKKYRLRPQELFDGWVDALISIYSEYDSKVDDPLLAIVDFEHSSSYQEFKEFVRRFEKAGMRTVIAWMHEIIYVDSSEELALQCEKATWAGSGLYTRDGQKIDVIYRRAVTSEIIDAISGNASKDETIGAKALIQAFERHEVCLIGGFKTQIAHCKQIYQVLHHKMTSDILSENERDFIKKHIPFTAFLTPDEVDIDEIIKDKDAWIVKPSDRYGSSGVFAGRDQTQDQWEKIISERVGTKTIIQRYCEQFPTLNCMPYPANEPLEPWNNLIGFYNYAGKLGGLFNRAGRAGIIVGYAGGITVPTFLVGDRSEFENIGDIRERNIDAKQ